MCGIAGVINSKNSSKLLEQALNTISYRGRDGRGTSKIENGAIGHLLHSVVGLVKQPFVVKENGKIKTVFAANCEIYNWQELNETYKLNAKNDAELLFKLIHIPGTNQIKETLNKIDGVYAFAYFDGQNLILGRDLLGEKPIWYAHQDYFAFASEKKALEKIGFTEVNELNPRKILVYDIKKNSVSFIEREFFAAKPENQQSFEEIKKETKELLLESVEKRIPEKKAGLLFSGGVDSTVLAKILKDKKQDFTCYITVLDEPSLKKAQDLEYAVKAAKKLGLKLKIIKIKMKQIPKVLKKIVPLIEDSNVVKVGVALTFFLACKQAKKDKCKVIFSGLGSEEIFAGYQRHKNSSDINRECLSGLIKIYERDLYRDDVITMFNGLELRLPYLDTNLVEYALKIPVKYKLQEERDKIILREIAKEINVPSQFAERKKKAAQYGSNMDKAIQKLAKKNGFKLKSEYLLKFYPKRNVKLGALVSTGKDSIYAMHTMMKQNYEISCMITIKSKNLDSFMFHTPAIELAELQAKAMSLPLITAETKGKKEEELLDLEKAIKKAKQKYKIQGLVCGAIFSNYQRERIEKICEKLSLKIFTPLWHLNQETEMKELLNFGFKIIMVKIAAEGLDKTWLAREITLKDVDRLVEVNKKIGLNVAGEGGEFETLVLDAPIFKQKIQINNYSIKEEGKNIAWMEIRKAELREKNNLC